MQKQILTAAFCNSHISPLLSPSNLVDLDHGARKDEKSAALIDTAFCDRDRSALKLLQQQDISCTSEQNVSWIAEPMHYKKNLGAAFEDAENVALQENMSYAINRNDQYQQQQQIIPTARCSCVKIKDPTPSKSSEIGKIEDFEQKSAEKVSKTSSKIEVYLRLRPSSDDTQAIHVPQQKNPDQLPRCIQTVAPETSHAAKLARNIDSVIKEYEFTGVFPHSHSQHSVYANTVQPLLPGLLIGQSALIFCYGITNSGKTYTITGNSLTESEWGLLPRAMRHLVQMCGNNRALNMSYFEVYNEQLVDLLRPPTKQDLIFPDRSVCKNAEISHCKIDSVQDGMQQISLAQKRRRSGTNGINAISSRSHAICRLSVCGKPANNADLWIVDLAGSERAKRTNGRRWQEAIQINKSLSTLNRCIMALRHSSKLAPPFRESRLTQFFGQHWTSTSAARTVMIVNVNPAASDFDETQHALTYASAAKTLRVGNHSSCSSKQSEMVYGYDGRRILQSVAGSCLANFHAVVQQLTPNRRTEQNSKKRNTNTTSRQYKAKRLCLNNSDANKTNIDDYAKDDIGNLASEVKEVCSLSEMNVKMQTMKLQCTTEIQNKIDLLEKMMDRMKNDHVSDFSRQKQRYEHILQERDLELQQKDIKLHVMENALQKLKMDLADQSKRYIKSEAEKSQIQQQVEVLKHDIKDVVESKISQLQAKDACIDALEGHLKLLREELEVQTKCKSQTLTHCV